MYQRILVATDGSDAVAEGGATAPSTWRPRLGAELVALHVVPRYPMSYFEGGIGPAGRGSRAGREAVGRAGPGAGRRGGGPRREGRREGQAPRSLHSDLVAEAILAAAQQAQAAT